MILHGSADGDETDPSFAPEDMTSESYRYIARLNGLREAPAALPVVFSIYLSQIDNGHV